MKAINFTEEDRYMLVLSTGAILMTPKELFQIYGEKNYKEIDESLTVIPVPRLPRFVQARKYAHRLARPLCRARHAC
ncbi:MAG: hypothetical protein MJZ15_08940 [Bacteroidales bacterium]|nr:hypothetical protein [Bacteroidales bacterium]